MNLTETHKSLSHILAAFFSDHTHTEITEGCEYCDALRFLDLFMRTRINTALDNVATSVQMHTVPEGGGFADKHYVLNTIQFEKERINNHAQSN